VLEASDELHLQQPSAVDYTAQMSEARNAELTRAHDSEELNEVLHKCLSGIRTAVYGGSKILSAKHIEQIEAVSILWSISNFLFMCCRCVVSLL
jgi:hypothetical protein